VTITAIAVIEIFTPEKCGKRGQKAGLDLWRETQSSEIERGKKKKSFWMRDRMRRTERQQIRTATKFAAPSAGHSERAFCSSVTKAAEFMLLQTSHTPLTITVEALRPSIAAEKHTVACS
jgi:hypothetical protein